MLQVRAKFRSLRDAARRWARIAQPRYRGRRYGTVLLDVARFPYMGFGATIAWLHMAHVAADATSARLQIVNPGAWPFGGHRPECALDRFLRLTDFEGEPGLPIAPFDPGDAGNLRDWGYFDELHWPSCAFGFTSGGLSLEDYRRNVLRRVYVPTDFATRAVAAKLEFLPRRYVAWHVRRGDKVAGPSREDDLVPLARYVEATAALLREQQSPPQHVVICTDSPTVIDEARTLPGLRELGLQVSYDPAEKRWDGYCELHRAGRIDDAAEMVAEVLTAQKVIEILRRAEHLVGCNSSYLFRVGAMLHTGGTTVSLSENKVFRKYFPL